MNEIQYTKIVTFLIVNIFGTLTENLTNKLFNTFERYDGILRPVVVFTAQRAS